VQTEIPHRDALTTCPGREFVMPDQCRKPNRMRGRTRSGWLAVTKAHLTGHVQRTEDVAVTSL